MVISIPPVVYYFKFKTWRCKSRMPVKTRIITAGSALTCEIRRDILKGRFIKITTDKIKTFPFPHLRIPSPYRRGHLSLQRSDVALRHRRTNTSRFSFLNIWLVDTGRQTDRHRKCVVHGQTSVQIATRNNSQQCSYTSLGSQKYWQSISPCDMRLLSRYVTSLKMIFSKHIETYHFRVCTSRVRKVKIQRH
jgi:hypothetical protein